MISGSDDIKPAINRHARQADALPENVASKQRNQASGRFTAGRLDKLEADTSTTKWCKELKRQLDDANPTPATIVKGHRQVMEWQLQNLR